MFTVVLRINQGGVMEGNFEIIQESPWKEDKTMDLTVWQYLSSGDKRPVLMVSVKLLANGSVATNIETRTLPDDNVIGSQGDKPTGVWLGSSVHQIPEPMVQEINKRIQEFMRNHLSA